VSSASTLLTQFHVKIDGAFVPEAFMHDVFEVSVQNSLHLPDVATIVLNDKKLAWIDDALCAPGKEMQVLGTASPQKAKPNAIFDGEIVELEPEFGAKTHRLTVRAFDRLHRLSRGRFVRTFQNVTDGDLATQFAKEAGLTPDIDPTRQVHEHLFQNNQTNLEFLRQRATEIGYLCYVLGKTFHFKKLAHATTPVTLDWGSSLSELHIRMTTVSQVNKVSVRGWDPKAKQKIVSEATTGEGMRKIGEAKSGGDMAKDAFHIDAGMLVASGPIRAQVGADQAVKAAADRFAERFIEAEGACGGNPAITAGATVKIESVGKRFGGEYFVTAATHRFTVKEGYTTQFTVSGQTPSSLLRFLQKDDASGHRLGLVIGLVTDNQDPLGWGRVKVKFPWLSDEHASDWARVVSVGGGSQRGIEFLPEIDDEVLVGFEMGDMHSPYVLGGLWNGRDDPPKKSREVITGGKVTQRIIRSRSGHSVVLDDADGAGSITIEDKNGNKMMIDSASNALSIDVKGNLTIDAKGTLSIKAGGPLTIQGAVIKLN
jgi:phage protein D/phage baseplate assembly protein gpV